jgi:hypothetical protein
MARWVGDRWFALAENSILLVIATLCWALFQPSLETAQTFGFGWIAQIWVRNLVLMTVVAGGCTSGFTATSGKATG